MALSLFWPPTKSIETFRPSVDPPPLSPLAFGTKRAIVGNSSLLFLYFDLVSFGCSSVFVFVFVSWQMLELSRARDFGWRQYSLLLFLIYTLSKPIPRGHNNDPLCSQ